jgi:hypothetical protein
MPSAFTNLSRICGAVRVAATHCSLAFIARRVRSRGKARCRAQQKKGARRDKVHQNNCKRPCVVWTGRLRRGGGAGSGIKPLTIDARFISGLGLSMGSGFQSRTR